MGRLSNLIPPLARLREDVERLFRAPLGMNIDVAAPEVFGDGGYPEVNLWEEGERVYAEVELPGIAIDQVELLVCGDQLTIGGKRLAAAEALPGAAARRSERPAGEFRRIVTLPAEIEAEQVEAKLADGVLTVTCPKSARVQTRKISVSAA